ncbi:MAG: deoxyguanosinetriphosphate triphosphohydrolase [candidate division Zixibacteria bacterium]|nr:deoxyguanosinetriphosphate triphosphohydrolase [candidate division Zixibacteria bacterium]MDH3937145.1 deoxyguanosinetriphosphate triphosphohydrolase [candidate division Zixibacteria bacterium]
MMLVRAQIEKMELDNLAPYAALSCKSRGRIYALDEHPLRTAFQRDRDRIIHSAAFRRLEYKTQVFIPHEKDHFRTRLTHTIEVAQVARTLARNLRLNEDLTEAIALVHDLGHTPFGHAGEDVLDELLQRQGGFNHNRQSLRVVDILEQRYRDHPGLNLSYEVREGIVKHETRSRIDAPGFEDDRQPTLEAALVDIADEIAYNSHDIDDGLSAGIISFDDLVASDFFVELVGGETLRGVKSDDDFIRHQLVRRLVDRMATDVINETFARVKQFNIHDLETVRTAPEKICAYSEDMRSRVRQLKSFLRDRLYNHARLVSKSQRASEIMTAIFDRLVKEPLLMPVRFQKMLDDESVEIVAADYIAGMTDRFAEKVYGEVGGG